MSLSALLSRISQEAGVVALQVRLEEVGNQGPSPTRPQSSSVKQGGRVPGPSAEGDARWGASALRFSVLDAARPAVLAALHGELAQPTILVVARLARARQLADELSVWARDANRVYVFPELDALPYERLAPGAEHLHERMSALLALTTDAGGGRREGGRSERQAVRPPAVDPPTPSPLVVVTARAAMDRLMTLGQFRGSISRVRVGDQLRVDHLLAGWVRAGYEPVSVVEGPGEFARRGGILDVFPCGQADPRAARGAYRLELWGNEVESIRLLDPATQRSGDSVEEVVVGAAHEVLPTLPEGAEEQLGRLDLRHLKPRVADEIENEIRQLREGQPFPTLEWYRGVLGAASVLDYLPEGGLLILDEPGSIAATVRELHRQSEELSVDLLARGEAPSGLPRPYYVWDELAPRLLQPERRRLDLVLDPEALDSAFQPAPSYSGRLPDLVDAATGGRQDGEAGGLGGGDAGTRLVIVSQQAARLEELLSQAVSGERTADDSSTLTVAPSPRRGLAGASPSRRVADAPPGPSVPISVLLVQGSLNEGWANPSIGLTVLTDRELFGWAKVRRGGRRPGFSARERFFSDLDPGELVVHVDHGIGRYRGLVRLADRATGVEREYIDIEYAEGGRLRVPVDHADRVGRYVGSGEAVPRLTRLGSGEWQRAKRRIRSAVRRIARELVELYARREMAEGTALGPDTQWQMELEASFPYVETPDQLQAVQEVKEDQENARPMDRLLVGDVGYGKTEVALRAAFKVVSSGKQVGVLVPTTVLAQQHFNTFRERLAPFPVRVEMLSRFLTDRQAREVVEGVHDGRVDIVIGTHRLLQADVDFKDLGLVVIDEEQRFGVAHKERFKELRTEVDVLTLSATPIPRTLHLSLVGVRDLSMIQTPPEERLPIRTYVTEHSEGLIREAVLRELDRGGQVYFVHNRVYSISDAAARLSALVPEARIAIGHGQMGDDDLEETMLRFANGDADVLVCTTIIEAGLDLPNVNTLVVTNAHQFGLSQLYQLRGRVGRGSNRAYAYFLYPPDRVISETAEKRLRAIFEATELGAGYSIALKDLEIRGAGNLLGVEQHGHISAVGFDLYCRLLGEAVEQLKALHDHWGAAAPQTPRGDEAAEADGVVERVISGALVEQPTAAVDLPLDVSLPRDYVSDESVRLNLYQRLALVAGGPALGELMSEVEDRFGPLPEPAVNLFYLLSLRIAAAEAGVEEISVDGHEVVVRFPRPRPMDPAALSRQVGMPIKARTNQLRMPLGRGAQWLEKLRALVDALEPPPG